jgi:hypothetical protein
MSLPGIGVAKYGAFTFPPDTTETVDFRIVPEYDPAGRATPYAVHTWTLRAVIATADQSFGTEDQVALARRELCKPAQRWEYRGRGLGDLRLNVTLAGPRDVQWGPKPRHLSIKPLGGKQACEVTWTVEACFPTCGDARFRNAPMAYTFRLTYDVDRSGLTTRTYAGVLKIPQTRLAAASTGLLDSADNYRELVAIAPVPGVRREHQSYELDESKCALTFSVTDAEMPGPPPPPGFVEVRASHAYAMAGPTKLTQWVGTLEATYEVARNGKATAGDAVRHFYEYLWAARRDEMRSQFRKKPLVRIIAFTWAEPEIYGRQYVKISMQYIVSAATLQDFLPRSRLWEPVPGDWRKWWVSVAGVLGPRGAAKLKFNAGDDALVDLCRPRQVVSAVAPPVLVARAGPAVRELTQDPPDPETSWLDYFCAVSMQIDNGTVVTRTLPPTTSTERTLTAVVPPGGPAAGGGVFGAFDPIHVGFALPTAPTPTAPPLVGAGGTLSNEADPGRVQRRVNPTVWIFLTGHAVRAGFEVPCPALTEINGVPLVECNRPDKGEGFTQAMVGSADAPLYRARWCVRYTTADGTVPPGRLPVPPNPLHAPPR